LKIKLAKNPIVPVISAKEIDINPIRLKYITELENLEMSVYPMK